MQETQAANTGLEQICLDPRRYLMAQGIHTYCQLINGKFSEEEATELGTAAMMHLLGGVDAGRDPLETMLLEQMIWCHERIRSLSVRSTNQGLRQGLVAVHSQCDKAMNSFRKSLIALTEYRARRDAAAATNAFISSKKKATNELGANHGDREADSGEHGKPETLDGLDGGGNGHASRNGKAEPAVAAFNGSAHRRW